MKSTMATHPTTLRTGVQEQTMSIMEGRCRKCSGNPPTSADHKWNPNATKIVLPISDEGPKDGDPATGADDTASIEEAHDSCVRAGVVPVGMYGQTYVVQTRLSLTSWTLHNVQTE